VLDELKMERKLLESIESNPDEELFQASMGIYVFNRQVLVDCLSSDLDDFGKHVIPKRSANATSMLTFLRAIGKTSGQFALSYDANLDLTNLEPQYSFLRRRHRLHSPTLPPWEQNQWRDPAAGDHFRRLHHFRRAYRT